MEERSRGRRLRTPSPAMVVACIALAVALSGASYAAVVLPRDSVGALQLKRNAVTAVKIRNGSATAAKLANRAVTTAKLAPSAVTAAKLADNAVGSAEVSDGAVGNGELADGSVTSAKIADGSVARADLAPGIVLPTSVVHTTTASTTTSTTFVDLPGAVAFINVPAGVAQARLVIRFAAESTCHSGLQWCSVRVLVDGFEAEPAAGVEFAFDSTDVGSETEGTWEAHALERTAVVGPGAHTVWVQWRVRSTETFSLDDWMLVVEQHLTG